MNHPTATSTVVADLAEVVAFVANHPNLPAMRSGVTIAFTGGEPGLHVILETAEQVKEWADALGVTMYTVVHKPTGNTHHTAVQWAPFYASIIAITTPEATS